LRESEGGYRSLLESMEEGVAYCRRVYVGGRPTEFVYLTVNEVFGRYTGLHDVAGKRVVEVISGIRESDPEIFESCGAVALTGTYGPFERFVKALGLRAPVEAVHGRGAPRTGAGAAGRHLRRS
jgi:PAS domain-containing protein